MKSQNGSISNRGLLGAAAILGVSVIASSAALGWWIHIRTQALEQQIARLPAPSAQPGQAPPPSIETAKSPKRGPDSAPVKLIEWVDFQCPFCQRVGPTLDQIATTYGDKVQIVFKHFPLPSHPDSRYAHAAAEAAKEQGRFWEMHDRILQNPRDVSMQTLQGYAKEIGLDLARFEKDRLSLAVSQRIDADIQEGIELGVNGTPGFHINGKPLSGALPFAAFQRQIDAALAAK